MNGFEKRAGDTTGNTGVGEEPAHLAGRLEEYHVLQSVKAPSMAKETEKAYKAECLAVFEKIKRDCPWMFAKVIYPLVAHEAFPQRRPNRMERAIEGEYLRTPGAINMLPTTMTRRVMIKYRLPHIRYREILRYSQAAKKRLKQRERDEAKRRRRLCLDERTQ